jgi:hypothetical protein
MNPCCEEDDRRDAVRRMPGLNGLDYVEVDNDQTTLRVFFLGKLPPELSQNRPGIEQYLRVEGGQRVTGIGITDADPLPDPDPEKDDQLVVYLDKAGDFSTYTLRLVGVANIDPRYNEVEFSFKTNCPSDLDCSPVCECVPETALEPEIDYLAKDYGSFRKIILDRLALLLPEWKERHVPDLGMALVELLAYTGDYLSYYQDAVATEAYLETARERISVRRHARLVDYFLHEGCNARAWVSVEVDTDVVLSGAETTFVTGIDDAAIPKDRVLTWEDLRNVPTHAYEVFEPLRPGRADPISLYRAFNAISFYTWGEKACCLARGSTSATLRDAWVTPLSAVTSDESARILQPLAPGDVLILEELRGPVTGLPEDADPRHRHAVRLTRVTPGEDALIKTDDGRPTPYVTIEWAAEDALPFPVCISAIGLAPECAYIDDISVARGNIILVDHGRTQEPEDLGAVPTLTSTGICECIGQTTDIQVLASRYRPRLAKIPLTYADAVAADNVATPAAATLMARDARAALPQIALTSQPAFAWRSRYDLIDSRPDDYDFVVEIDNDRVAHLRFGDGDIGFQPPAGMAFNAVYRTGNGTSGNVGPEAISRLVLKTLISGVSFKIRNPLPAIGGTDPEPLSEAKLYAPHTFRKKLERAVIARDYETLAEDNAQVQRASAELAWTGSWYEADVAIDPLGSENAGGEIVNVIQQYLAVFRRMGHDLRVERARYVPIDLTLDVCVLPHYQRAHVKAALLNVFSNRRLPGGKLGFFHPDNVTFGEGVFTSKIVAAAQAVPGVECARVTVLKRRFASPNHEIENGVLPLRNGEIVQLDNDPNYPERGKLEIDVRGGR